MSRQRLIDALKGKRTDRPAWVPFAGVHAAALLGLPADAYLGRPDVLARCVVEAARRYRADGIPLLFDLSVEAEAVGCPVKWWPDNVPTVAGPHPCEARTPLAAGLSLPAGDTGRYPLLYKAARIARPQLEDLDCGLIGLSVGPITLASHLAGTRIFTDIFKNPDFAHTLFAFCGELTAVSSALYADMGCDVVCISDPLATQLNPSLFEEFVARYCRPAVAAVCEAGKTSAFFVCGDATRILEPACALGTDAICVDEQVNLQFVRDMAVKHGKGFMGNLKLTMALSLGLIPPREDALAALAAGGTTGFTLAPGCDLPYWAPPEHVEQVIEAMDWFRSYYAPYPDTPAAR